MITKEIKTKKRQIKLLEEANFYTEEVRRIVNKSYGYDNLYKGGLSIRTPLNLHNVPTSAEGLKGGDVWNNRGVLNIVVKLGKVEK